jgi:uncharacterized protein YdhG (YjbR/CyaY superfamily)
MKAEYKSVNEYIAQQPPEFRDRLGLIRQTVRKAVPDAEELLSYMMPAFKYHGMLCYYAVFKDHYSLFVAPKVKDAFTDRLKGYKQTKSAIHFPFNGEIPVGLITEIVTFTAITNLEKAEAKKSAKKK